jgi:predicted Rossmann fold flavoprotein
VKAAHEFDAVILGGGAAGLMCAIEAGRRGRKVAVLERAERAGKKILISGGGRCNFTNIYCQPENFLSANPHFAKSALARYTPADFIALVEKHKIAYHEKKLGQLFCDGSAREIVAMLESECASAGVEIVIGCDVHEVSRKSGFVLETNSGEFRTEKLVVATGGLSIPKIGATDFGYRLARQFGLEIREPRPALVPLVFAEPDRKKWCNLSGVSAEVIASCGGQSFREKMLITHQGLSGPAILQASSYWGPSKALTIDLAPGRSATAKFGDSRISRNETTLRGWLQTVLPSSLAVRWLNLNPPAAWNNAGLEKFENSLHHWNVVPWKTAGYEKAEVTAGGVDTDGISAKTMECRKIPGLYFIGEVVDVTGQLGGFNFQWAWASGAAAGRAL